MLWHCSSDKIKMCLSAVLSGLFQDRKWGKTMKISIPTINIHTDSKLRLTLGLLTISACVYSCPDWSTMLSFQGSLIVVLAPHIHNPVIRSRSRCVYQRAVRAVPKEETEDHESSCWYNQHTKHSIWDTVIVTEIVNTDWKVSHFSPVKKKSNNFIGLVFMVKGLQSVHTQYSQWVLLIIINNAWPADTI